MKTIRLVSFWLIALTFVVQARTVQDAIQAAAATGRVELPAGEYSGSIFLPEGFTLVGAGAGHTILDGAGAGTVVFMANNAALIGCTIRNGQIGIRSQKGFMGVFACEVADIIREGIRLDGGSACLVNNVLDCGTNATGIAIIEANPYVGRNVIQNNQVGVRVQGPLVPILQANVFQGNETAVVVQDGASVELVANIFDGNRTLMTGQDLTVGNEIRAARPEELLIASDVSPEGSRSMMQVVMSQAIAGHPLVQYNLPTEPGRFALAILHPSATFQIMASAPDTVIESYDAYDGLTDQDLQAAFVTQGVYPGVAVDNPEIRESHLDRYVLEKIYIHPASFAAGPDGTLIFDRLTNLPRIEVLLPPGCETVSANPGAQIDNEGSRQRVYLETFGTTRVHVVMKPRSVLAP
ncbi:MAG TPA: NosD domain-containing protein [Kiritimatiellia bacterium]|jgi:hypothetical protein|nr:NosD domain-containing protein [Kiritimatiellia bacterium]